MEADLDLDVIKPCRKEIVRVWGGSENGLEKIQSVLFLDLLYSFVSYAE